MNINETTKLLSRIDRNSTSEDVLQIFNNARFDFRIPSDTLNIGNILYRATIVNNENEITDIKRLSYKPAYLNKGFGRASTPNNTMFYGLLSNSGKLGVLGSMSEVCPCIRNHNAAENKYYKVLVSRWEVISEIELAMISDPEGENRSIDMIDTNYGKSLNPEQKNFVKLISNSFRKEATNEKDYLISAIFTELMTRRFGFEGVAYESVQSSPVLMKENLCIAICPEIADSCLKFTGGDLYEFDFVRGETIVPKITKSIIQVGNCQLRFTLPHLR